MLKLPIYLDNHATTRCDPRVVEAMLPYFLEHYGNAASVSHRFGWDAEKAVELAREKVAGAIGAEPREIVFTSGSTEANNLAIKGVLPYLKKRGNHVIASAVEHKSVLDPLKRLARDGWNVTFLPPDGYGRVAPEVLESAITDQTVLVSIIAANNEIGTINPIVELGRICRQHKVVFHTDATQAVAKTPLDVNGANVDLLSLSGHKLYGSKGIGALYVRRTDPQVRLVPLFDGGGHERGFRSGTVAVPLAVGFGEAVALSMAERDAENERVRGLRDRLFDGIRERVPEILLNGHPTERLCGNLNLSFSYVEGEALMMAMRDIAVSSGSACTSAEPEPSHVLQAIGLDEDLARASLRFGIGRFNTAEEIEYAIVLVCETVERLRQQSAIWKNRVQP